jgi:hypothetical protein
MSSKKGFVDSLLSTDNLANNRDNTQDPLGRARRRRKLVTPPVYVNYAPVNCWKCKMSACADGSMRQSGPGCTQLWARLMLWQRECWRTGTNVHPYLRCSTDLEPESLRMMRGRG